MNYLKSIRQTFLSIAVGGVLLQPVSLFAQTLDDFNLLGINDFNGLLGALTTFLTNLALPFATLVIIWGGFQYFQGGFDQKASGRRAIESAIIGLALVYGVGFITTLVRDVIQGGDKGGLNFEPIAKLLDTLSVNLTLLAGFAAVLVIIWGGYQYFLSSVAGQKANGLDTIKNGILGLIAIILATPIVNLVKSIIGDQQSSTLNINRQPLIDFILNILKNFVIPISSVITVVLFVIGGYYYLTAGLNDGNAKKGRDIIRNAVIGLIIVLTAFTLTQIIVFVVKGFSF
jgi:TRAP-type C4-dicarboxylate transport system permease small subunit